MSEVIEVDGGWAWRKKFCVSGESLWKKRERRLNGARALKKSDLLKIKSAAELRKQTAMSMAWIAKELVVGGGQHYLQRDEEAEEGKCGWKRKCYVNIWSPFAPLIRPKTALRVVE
jgi:hypothetical protein